MKSAPGKKQRIFSTAGRNHPALSENARQILRQRYLLRNNRQEIIETPAELFLRIARVVAAAEKAFRKKKQSATEIEEKFYQLLANLEFIPNSPTLMNAGTRMGQLSACFVLPVNDSMDSIFSALRQMALIHQTGGGTGFNFSRLRPKNDLVRSTKGRASGPVSFMRIYDRATSVIIQGGRRRGANMGMLHCNHPDILEFIEAKEEEGQFDNFNLSVAVTNRFMQAVLKGEIHTLRNPRTGKTAGKIPARQLFSTLVQAAWHSGDPGLIFIDEINRHNPTPELGKIASTNPCGELPLLPYESCNLGSINLARLARNGKLNWARLQECIHLGVRFLDNVIEVNRYIIPEVEKITRGNRKIGLGIMGFSDLLIQLGISYASPAAVAWAQKIMRFIQQEAHQYSVELARERGTFPNYKHSIYYGRGQKYRLRNATCTTIAPTGTISIIANCSSGIEPLFALSYLRKVIDGSQLLETNPYFAQLAHKHKFYSRKLLRQIAATGTLRGIKEIPVRFRRLFTTALDITPHRQLEIQAACQRYTDNSVSKTINLPAAATPATVRKIYLNAWQLKCKGITVYRYGTKKNQTLSIGLLTRAQRKYVRAQAEYSGGCPAGKCHF